jgi:hypothetical protein
MRTFTMTLFDGSRRAIAATTRPLQALAALLTVAIVALFVVWIGREPVITPVPVPHANAASTTTSGRPVGAAESVDPGVGPRVPDPPATAAPPGDSGAGAMAAVLFGVVRRADGTSPAEGALDLHRGGAHAGAQSLRTGTFAFAGLQPGAYRLTSRIADELPLDREVTIDAPTTRLDIDLGARWQLTVDAVTPDGTALREATKADPLAFRSVRALASRDSLAGDLPGAGNLEIEAGLGTFRGDDMFGDRRALPKQTIGVLTLPADRPVHIALVFGSALLAQQPATPSRRS